MTTKEKTRPLASLVTEVISEVAYLIQTEIRLARAELGEKLGSAANGGTLIGIGALLLLPGLFVLLMDVVRWLEISGVPDQWALLLVGSTAFVIGAVLAFSGAQRLRTSALMPHRTLEQVRADVSVVKEQTT